MHMVLYHLTCLVNGIFRFQPGYGCHYNVFSIDYGFWFLNHVAQTKSMVFAIMHESNLLGLMHREWGSKLSS